MALNKAEAIIKAKLDERQRAINIVTEVFGGTPNGTISHHNWLRAIEMLMEEDNNE